MASKRPRPLKIAISCRAMGHSVGGVREYTHEMVREMVNAGSPHSFILYYADEHLVGTHAAHAREVMLRAPHKLVWDHWMLPRALRRDRPDVVWFPQNVISLGVKIPAVVTLHDLLYFNLPEFPHREYLWPDILYMRAMIPRSARQASKVVCVSEHTAADARRVLGVGADSLNVIREAPSRVFLASSRDSAVGIRAKYGLQRPFFLYSGTRSVRKNIRVLFEAFARCKEDIPHDLVLTGGGGHVVVEDRAEDTLAKYGLQGRVKVLGMIPQEDLIALYHEADTFVFPSRYEGFGLPPLEAMACGCPVICSNATALPEVVGDAALVFDPVNVAELAEHMRMMAGDSELRDRMRGLGHAQVARFSYQRAASEMIALLEGAI